MAQVSTLPYSRQDTFVAHSSSLSCFQISQLPFVVTNPTKSAAVGCFKAPEEDNEETWEGIEHFLMTEKEKIATETFWWTQVWQEFC